jgi:hypothetical protein
VNENDFLTIAVIAAASAWSTVRVVTAVLRHNAAKAAAARKAAQS